MPTHDNPPIEAPLEVSASALTQLTAAQRALKRAEKSLQAATRALPQGIAIKRVNPDMLTTVEAIARLVTPAPVCTVPGCGRPVRVHIRGLCQTHYKFWRTTGEMQPIHPRQPNRAEVTRLSGLSLSPECAEQITREAHARGLARNAVITDVIEEWGREFWAHERARLDKQGNTGSKPEKPNRL